MSPIYELAAQHDLPVFIHSDATSIVKKTPVYLWELEEALSRHPGTRIVWCHSGMSRRLDVPRLPEEVFRLLGQFPNLLVDLSWNVLERCLMPGGRPDRSWVGLVEAYPERFMVGSDVLGNYGSAYRNVIELHRAFLSALKPETARKIGIDNFLSVLPWQIESRSPSLQETLAE